MVVVVMILWRSSLLVADFRGGEEIDGSGNGNRGGIYGGRQSSSKCCARRLVFEFG